MKKITLTENELRNLIKNILDEIQESQEIKERCWKGYTQKGMKTMFGKRYPNCVKKKASKNESINILSEKLISEQKTQVYTDKKQYDKALKLYNLARIQANLSKETFEFLKNLKVPNIGCGDAEDWIYREINRKFSTYQTYSHDLQKYEKSILSQMKKMKDWIIVYSTDKLNNNKYLVNTVITGKLTNQYDYDRFINREKLSPCGAHYGSTWELIMAKPIYQEMEKKVEPKNVVIQQPVEKPIEPKKETPTPKQTRFMISWNWDWKCDIVKFYDTYETLQKEIKDKGLVISGMQTHGTEKFGYVFAAARLKDPNQSKLLDGPFFNSCTQKFESPKEDNLMENEDDERDKKEKKDDTAKYIKCRNCKKKFTQTIYKGKKSKPICPYCGTHNDL